MGYSHAGYPQGKRALRLYALHGMARRRFDLFAISLVVLQSGWWVHWLKVSGHVAAYAAAANSGLYGTS